MIIVAATLLASSVGQAYSQSEGEVVLFDSLSSTYSDYLLTLTSSSEIQEEDAVRLIGMFEDALQVWSYPSYRRYAREVIVSLNNAREYWMGSLDACDDMISETDDPGVLFDFQYDRWTVLQRLDGSFRQADGNLSVIGARDSTIATFLKIYNDEPYGRAIEERALRFVALAWYAVQDPFFKNRLTLAKSLVEIGEMPVVARTLGNAARQNQIGYLVGLLVEKEVEVAADYIASIKDEKGKLLACTIALETAQSEQVSSMSINEFLWAVDTQFESDPIWLNLVVRHALAAIEQERLAAHRQLKSGDGIVHIDGVPSEDILNLIEPAVSNMLVTSKYNRYPTHNDSLEFRQDYAVLHTSIVTLVGILELMGSHQEAVLYLELTNKTKQRALQSKTP